MIITLRNHENECDEIYTNISRITETATEIKLYKEGGFVKEFDKDIYSLQRKDGWERVKIIYDDLTEFAEVRLRCENTRHKSMCKYCPFYDRCQIDDNENLHTMCCEIISMQVHPTEKGGAQEWERFCLEVRLNNTQDGYMGT